MSLSHDNNTTAGANRISNILDRRSSPGRSMSPAMRSSAMGAQTFGSESHANVAHSPRMARTPVRASTERDEPSAMLRHERTSSTASSVQRQQSPAFPPHFAASGPSHTFNGNHHAGPGAAGRRGSSSMHETTTPPRIRQTRSEMHPKNARAGSSSGSSANGHSIAALVGSGGGGGGSNNSNADDASRTNYSLWLPWEETALIDWLYEPINCKLFNEPRRKKECHERIIREILPGKTSRAIEGKIRTLEKRYLKAASEIHRPDFATKHPGKHPDDVSEMLCNNFYKLETIFNPSQALPRSQLAAPHLPPHQQPQPSKKSWSSSVPPPLEGVGAGTSTSLMPGVPFGHSSHSHSPTLASPNAAGGAATLTTASASTIAPSANAADAVPGSSMVSIPRASPPRLANTESLPYRLMGQTRKIAPKRGADGSTEPGDGDGPTMMSESKRSRTFPTMMPNHSSPQGQGSSGDQRSAQQMHMLMQQQQQQQPKQQQHASRLQRSPMNIQHLQILPSSQQTQHQHQQYRLLENGRYSLDIGTRPATATLPLMPIPSPMGGVGQASSSAGPQAAAAGGAIPIIREPQENSSNSGGQVQAGMPSGSREELEWLQFNLRREELEFRKNAFAHEQEMETQRVKFESHRLEIQKREMELEAKRIETQQRQMDVQVESLKSLTTMLGQMVSHMGALLAANVSGAEAAHPVAATTAAATATDSAVSGSQRERLESTPEEGEEEETTI
ncbi:hypothetical protein LPJ53_000678 [Coemansia erecta]|uniref:Uncharacterized protein n=1 Tax=Coemansia erecta TaxID=147472 RepID=A0A9W7Y816_9FUNG|nr:hypothetical protein LPJ53_000678 [Coemansia erecta]